VVYIFNRFKNLFIVILVLISIYLSSVLWFQNLSGQSFVQAFSTYFNVGTPNTTIATNPTIQPYKIVTHLGDNNFDILFSNIPGSVQMQQSEEIIKEVLLSGTFIYSTKIPTYFMIDDMYISYDFPFSMPISFFYRSFGMNRSRLNSHLKYFNSVIIKPSSYDTITVLFIDTPSKTYHKFLLEDIELVKNLNTSLYAIKSTNTVTYTSYSTSIYNMIYTPTALYQRVIYKQNPYSSRGQINFESVLSQIYVFLNPKTMSEPRRLNGAYTFGDRNTIVIYYPTNVIDYSNYDSSRKNNTSSLLLDYNKAIDFLAKDIAIVNDFYLSSFSEDGDIRTFYFNYTINNMPIFMSQNLKDYTGLTHMLEVTVQRGHVIRYRKYAYSFILSDRQNKAIPNHGLDLNKNNVKALYLGYKICKDSSTLSWFYHPYKINFKQVGEYSELG
jgi:hypothetical protein